MSNSTVDRRMIYIYYSYKGSNKSNSVQFQNKIKTVTGAYIRMGLFLFACRWAYNRGGGLISGWAYKRQFTVSCHKTWKLQKPFECRIIKLRKKLNTVWQSHYFSRSGSRCYKISWPQQKLAGGRHMPKHLTSAVKPLRTFLSFKDFNLLKSQVPSARSFFNFMTACYISFLHVT